MPEDTVLYRTIQAHLGTFLVGTSDDRNAGLPGFLRREDAVMGRVAGNDGRQVDNRGLWALTTA